MKPIKQTIDLHRVIIHPDAIMIAIPEASQKLIVVQHAVNTDIPFKVIKTGSRASDFMPIEIGDEVFIEEIGAQKVLQLSIKGSEEIIKCIMVYASNISMLLKQENKKVQDYDMIKGRTEFDKPLPDANVVSVALDNQRDGIC